MLRRLRVRNLAIIEDLELELGEGLTVISGETGAGKSILVDALMLLAGGRGSAELVRQGFDRLVVGGEFDTDATARAILEQSGLPAGPFILLRREISPDGRGRAFVDDEPAAVRTIARLSQRLIAIQGQNAELELADRDSALEILDEFGSPAAEREQVARAAASWAGARQAIEELEAAGRDRSARLETLDYQIHEIESVAPVEAEETELTRERDRLLHADRIRRAGETALAALSEDEGSAADRLGEAARAFAELAAIDPAERPYREEAEEIKRRVTDLAAHARDAAAAIEADPERLTAIETRLERISRIKRKYGGSVADALALLERMRAERSELSDLSDALERRRREEASARRDFLQSAGALSARRAASAARLSSAIESQLSELALEKARFRVALSPAEPDAPRPRGLESAQFLFAPNPGEPEKPVDRIASGGELSRLQLAIRCAAGTGKKGARTLVFDEVDAGIGGRTAEVVGRKLRALSRDQQVLCVTHVPQIAALADRHFVAEKRATRGRTTVSVRCVEADARVAEIARMLAGQTVPETAWKHARTLLAGGGSSKRKL
jgi:DNA repair protein RecN (Recombination protein N)